MDFQDFNPENIYNAYPRYQQTGQRQTLAPQAEEPKPVEPPPPPPPTQQQQNPFNYESARDSWMSGRYGRDEAGARQWASEHGISYNGGDVINLPNGGGMIDILGNFKSGVNVSNTWTPAGGNGDNPNGQPIGGSGSSGSGSGANSSFGLNTSLAHSGISKELYDMLMARAKQGTQIDRFDPNIRQQVDPYAAAQERARRNYLADLAEKSGPLANLRGEERLAMERAGQATGLFEAELVGRELANRRDEIRHALDGLSGRISDEQRLALTRELGVLEDATRRYGIDADSRNAQAQIGLGRDRLSLDYDELDWRRDPRNPTNFRDL